MATLCACTLLDQSLCRLMHVSQLRHRVTAALSGTVERSLVSAGNIGRLPNTRHNANQHSRRAWRLVQDTPDA